MPSQVEDGSGSEGLGVVTVSVIEVENGARALRVSSCTRPHCKLGIRVRHLTTLRSIGLPIIAPLSWTHAKKHVNIN